MSTTTIDGVCQFCKVPIRLSIDDDYRALNDPFGLLKLASCNRCADLRSRRRRLHEAFVETAALLIANRTSQDHRARAERIFEELTKKYLRLIAEWTNNDSIVWTSDLIQPFMGAPKSLSRHLGAMWRGAAQNTLTL